MSKTETITKPGYIAENPVDLIGEPEDMSPRDYMLYDIAMLSVRMIMGRSHKYSLSRCDLCPDDCREDNEKRWANNLPSLDDCAERSGFGELESMQSAAKKIAIILGGRA